MVDDDIPQRGLIERMQRLLAGRSPWKWGDSVGLTAGAVSRIMKGHLPAVEKLIPAVRIENLSLSWLAAGLGPPYLVRAPQSDMAVRDELHQALQDPYMEVALVFCRDGFSVVLSRDDASLHIDGTPYRYRRVVVLGGAAPGTLTMGALSMARQQSQLRVNTAMVDEAQWARLARGEMGTYEMFGDSTQPGLINADRMSYAGTESYVAALAEPAIDYKVLTDVDAEVLEIFHLLDDNSRAMLLRMLRGLRRK